jgi:hypothetical protein
VEAMVVIVVTELTGIEPSNGTAARLLLPID